MELEEEISSTAVVKTEDISDGRRGSWFDEELTDINSDPTRLYLSTCASSAIGWSIHNLSEATPPD